MNVSSALKVVGLGAAVFGVGVAGVLVGSALRSNTARTDAYFAPDPAALSLLKKGMAFPDAAVAGAENLTRTADVIGPGGAVFLFLDLECPPCADMARKWQDLRDLGAFPDLHVVAVTNQPPDVIASFARENGLTFPVVEDTEHLFLSRWRVQRFPLEVVVGPDGRIRSLSYDSVNEVDLSDLASRLAG